VDDARRAVAEAARAHFDFIKVYNSLTEEQFTAVMDEAATRRLPVLGHAVRSVGLERGFALGQVAVVHAEEYSYAELRRRRDSTSMAWAVEFTRSHDATVVPNLSAFEAITRQWGKPAVVDSFLALPPAAKLSSYWSSRWRDADYVTRRGTLDALPFLMRLTLALQRGGVRLLLGTDSPTIPGMFAGASIHDDLRMLVESGLTPHEALVAGTRAAGEFAVRYFGAEPSGLVAPGYRADLVLLSANPLEDIRNARAIVGVMARGRYSAVTLP
jgi:imidazolonepropionase-like amidohydrolase